MRRLHLPPPPPRSPVRVAPGGQALTVGSPEYFSNISSALPVLGVMGGLLAVLWWNMRSTQHGWAAEDAKKKASGCYPHGDRLC